MKINRRLIIIIAISGILAGVLSVALYALLKNEVQPQKQIRVPVMNTALSKDDIILEGNISYLKINEGAVTGEVVTDKSQLLGKKAVQKIRTGEPIYLSDIAERGEVAEPLKELYLIGVDVSNISSFLGTQLMQEETYYIVTAQGNIEVLVGSLVDSTGNAVYGDKQVAIKTIILGVKTLEEVKRIKELEIVDAIELVKFPERQH